MDQRERFRRAALDRGIPDDEVSGFVAHLRLSIRLSGGGDGVHVGHFGGSPRLPVGIQWPVGGDGPLPFVFAVDCAALPRVDGFALPADGTLLFFLDHERDHLADGEPGYAKVLHVPADADTEVADGPTDGDRYDVVAMLRAEPPDRSETDDDEDEDDDLPHRDELVATAYHLWPAGAGLASAYLGGHVDDDVLTSFAEQTLAGGGADIPVSRWYSEVEREKHRLASEWVTLARFSVSDELYSGTFVIRHDDLAAGRLDRALSVTRFSE